MDFITELLESKGCNAILIIINQLTKIRHYIVCKISKEGTFIEQTVRMYIKYI